MPPPPKATTTQPSKSELDWLDHARADLQKQPERLEDTAKFITGIVSISLTIFISNQPEDLAAWTRNWFLVATLLWLLSVVVSVFVLFPRRYTYRSDDPVDVMQAYKRVVRNKHFLLIISLGLFIGALAVACYAFTAGSLYAAPS